MPEGRTPAPRRGPPLRRSPGGPARRLLRSLGVSLVCLAALAPVPGRAQQQAATAPAEPQPDPSDAFRPDTVYRTPRGVTVVHLRTAGAPTVALRLQGVATGSDAGLELRPHLAVERARPPAERLGVDLRVTREPWGPSYTVAGARADLDALLTVLERAAAPPDPDPRTLELARERADRAREATRETPRGLLRDRLRRALGEAPAVAGLPPGEPADVREAIRRAWRRAHAPERTTLVVAGDVDPVLLGHAVNGLGSRGPEPPPPAPPREAAGTDVQTLRRWTGTALRLEPGELAAASVASRILAERLEGSLAARPGVEGAVELWRRPAGPALVVLAGAYAEDRAVLSDLLSGLTSPSPTPDAVRRTAAALGTELLLEGRTPGGLASVVGREAGPGDDPDAAVELLTALEGVGAEAVAGLLERMVREGVTREVRP